MVNRDEVVDVARALLRIDTTNLPGNETPAAELLRDVLLDAGVEAELVARDPNRANLVARIPGTGTGPSLAFVGHLDVVPADAREWTHPPFDAIIDDAGFLYGRGALDMKGEVAARTVALAELARSGVRPAGDVWLVVVADEEDGRADVGMSWLVSAMPEIRTDYAVNEGGGQRIQFADGRVVYTISTGEKGTLPVRVTAKGESGHASTPTRGDNAIPHLAALLQHMGNGLPPRGAVTADTRPFFETLLGSDVDVSGDLTEVFARITELDPSLAAVAPALSGTTMAPTMLSAGLRLNVLPSRASVDLDCRVLPGVTAAEVESDLRARLGDGHPYDLEWLDRLVPGSASPADGPLFTATAEWVASQEPDAVLLPMVSTGFTDSVFLRDELGVAAFGFSPTVSTPYEVVESTIHNADERIHVDDLARAVDYHLHLVNSLVGTR
ncbi:MAG: M20/M25/M40 family metallo-hydrolase [Candidatus Nanopelagicales bacterium]